MPINSVPVDQAAFTKFMLISIEPKVDRETGVQFTSKDGAERKWVVQVVAQLPSRWDAGRTESEVLAVTVTCAEDPSVQVMEGDKVAFDNLTVGVMNPEQDKDSGRIRGGKLFWGASGVVSRSMAGKS
ncbi:MAG: hypothetical protein ACXVBO_22710 [Isosphaeraceae bacterium]